MDTICPTETSLYRRRLCVVFLTRKTKILEDEDSAKALREYALRQGSSVRVKFAYLYGEVSLRQGTIINVSNNNINNCLVK